MEFWIVLKAINFLKRYFVSSISAFFLSISQGRELPNVPLIQSHRVCKCVCSHLIALFKETLTQNVEKDEMEAKSEKRIERNN